MVIRLAAKLMHLKRPCLEPCSANYIDRASGHLRGVAEAASVEDDLLRSGSRLPVVSKHRWGSGRFGPCHKRKQSPCIVRVTFYVQVKSTTWPEQHTNLTSCE